MKSLFFIMALTAVFFSCSSPDPRVLIYSPAELLEKEDARQLVSEVMRRFDESKTRAVRADTSSMIVEDSIKEFNALVFWQLDPHQLNYRQQTDLERFVEAGGSLVLLNFSTDTADLQFAWPWYNQLVRELTQAQQVAKASAANNTALHSFSYDGGNISYMPVDLGAAGGKASAESLFTAIQEAADRKRPDYAQAETLRVPDENRFVAVTLDNDLNEPMQMTILPDHRVLFIEREGLVKLYKPGENKTRVIAKFDVSTEGNYEDGLLGVATDPQFANNSWVYFYYSPLGGEPRQNLSRFKMLGDSLLMQSEKIVMEVPVQRETCCHSAGGIEFGPDGYLYLSTGDNTSSKESNGFTPIDERPGRAPFDAQKSSGNTQDLRGKILRIKLEENGTYSIPEGNLFSKDGKEGRPEIYVMGARNPFRFTIDHANGYVYWGDVGPDGGQDGVQGPQSYDEWNQARKPGNYGWPYFVGDNKAYPDWDFTTDTPGPKFDPKRPVNESPNNTGSKVLPAAQPALLWYPYGESEEFPMLGTGSRSAMAGPFYHAKQYGDSENKFPAYYEGKWFIYEWARSWIKVVSFDKDHNVEKIEPFMPNENWVKPIDMRFGPDGALYILEYGANYFANNDEARLVKVEYAEGNRAPVARIAADRKVGAAPLTVTFSAAESFDYDAQETLTYAWRFTDAKTVAATEKTPTYTFDKPGTYQVMLEVSDRNGKTSSASLPINVGNEPPEVTITVNGNRSFFTDGGSLAYSVAVQDKEDGSLRNGGITQDNLMMHFSYLAQGKDLALIDPAGGAGAAEFLRGKQLIEGSDCRSCHAMAEASVGPSYKDVALKYKGDYSAIEFLAKKIITGGGGVWGDRLMAAHPQHTEEETTEMSKYILSLADEKPAQPSLPLEGTLAFDQHTGKGEEGSYIFNIAYQDKGANGISPIASRETLVLRHPRVQAEAYDANRNVQQQRPQGGSLAYVSNIRDGSYIAFKAIDLTNISQLSYQLQGLAPGTIELRLDDPNGPVISKATVTAGKDKNFSQLKAAVQPNQGIHDLYFVFKSEDKEQDILNLDWIYFHQTKTAL